jgi:hypothetical protein
MFHILATSEQFMSTYIQEQLSFFFIFLSICLLKSTPTPKCERIVRGLCDCCKQQLCLQHLNEYNLSLINQLNPLIDEVNALGDQAKIQELDPLIDTRVAKQETTQRDIDLCREQIRQLEKEMNKIEETCFRISVRSLVIDNHLIQIREINLHLFKFIEQLILLLEVIRFWLVMVNFS